MPTQPVKKEFKDNYRKLYYQDDKTLLNHQVLYVDISLEELDESFCVICSDGKKLLAHEDYVIHVIEDAKVLKFVLNKRFIKRGALITVELFGDGYIHEELTNSNNKFKHITETRMG